jgi:hypothetical protein
MNSQELAQSAVTENLEMDFIFSKEFAHRLRLASIAEWIWMQDPETDPGAILRTATKAIDELIVIHVKDE